MCQLRRGDRPSARLQALPATPYCRDCAEEIEHRGGATEHESRRAGALAAPVPEDYNLLSGRELEDAIRDHLREDGRVDMEELRIVCRHGVVHLSGSVPSEREHQIVLQTITDVMGLKEVDDRLQVEEILWEREDRDKEESAPETRPWEDQVGTEDVTETHEDGTEFVPPCPPCTGGGVSRACLVDVERTVFSAAEQLNLPRAGASKHRTHSLRQFSSDKRGILMDNRFGALALKVEDEDSP